MSKKIVFFGTEDFSLSALQALVEAGFDIAAVVTKPDSPQGRGHKLTPPKVKVYATEHGIPVWQPTKLAEIADNVRALGEPAGVLVSYGKIIPQSILDLFHPGIINVHPSLLPKYRGPSPIEAAILNGDAETGISIMQLTADMDEGPVYTQLTQSLDGTEYIDYLYTQLGFIGNKLLVDTLPSIFDGSLVPLPQNDSQATYCQLINKSDGTIDWNKPAEQIEREIRAYKGWPQSRTKLGSVEVIITKAHTVPSSNGGPGHIEVIDEDGAAILMIDAKDGCLCIDTIKPLGKKEMPVGAFLAGYRSQLDV